MCGCACSTCGSQTELTFWNDKVLKTVFSSQLTKIKTIHVFKLLCLLLILNLRILGLNWWERHNYFPAWRVATGLIQATHFWYQIKSLKTQNVEIFPFVNLIWLCFCQITCIYPFSWIMNVFSREKRCLTSMAFWHQADPSCRLAHKFAFISRYTTWSRARRKFKLFP